MAKPPSLVLGTGTITGVIAKTASSTLALVQDFRDVPNDLHRVASELQLLALTLKTLCNDSESSVASISQHNHGVRSLPIQ